MSWSVVLRPLASDDIQQIHLELESQLRGLGGKFLDRLQELLQRIEAMPELYAPVWGMARAARVRNFRHIVYYVVLSDRVEVIAVIHGSRDSSVWKSRV